MIRPTVKTMRDSDCSFNLGSISFLVTRHTTDFELEPIPQYTGFHLFNNRSLGFH